MRLRRDERPLLQTQNIPAQPLGCIGNLGRVTQEAGAQEKLAALPKCGSGCQADTSLVDDVDGRVAAVRDAIDLEEGVERTIRLQRLHAIGGDQRIAENIARAGGLGDVGANAVIAFAKGSGL